MTVSTDGSGNQKPELSAEQVVARDAVIEADYCAGLKGLRQIGKENGLSHTAVAKMAKERGWVRNLQARIRAKADAKVSKAAVSTPDDAARKVATEAAVVEANANLQYQVRMRHRGTIDRVRGVLDRLLGEVEGQTEDADKLRETLLEIAYPIGEGEDANDRRQRARQSLEKHLGTPGRTATFKTLVETLEKLVRLERQAYGIEDGSPEDNPASAAGAAAAAAAGAGKTLSDVERAIRLHRLMAATPGAEA